MKKYGNRKMENPRLRKIVHLHTSSDQKPCWVKVGWVTEKTGWDFKQLERARKQRIVKYEKREDGSMWYDLSSINSLFLIK